MTACPLCAQTEDQHHLLLSCEHVQRIWTLIGAIDIPTCGDLAEFWNHHTLWNAPRRPVRDTAVLWSIWKSRNAKIVIQSDFRPERVVPQATSDIMLWANRANKPSLRDALCGEAIDCFM
jgi:hypothetical protein